MMKSDRIPALLFLTPSGRGNKGDDSMYEVTRLRFKQQFGLIRSCTLEDRPVTPEELREAEQGGDDIFFSLQGHLTTGHPLIQRMALLIGGIAVRVAQMINFLRGPHRKLQIPLIRSTVHSVVYGSWLLFNAFLLGRFNRVYLVTPYTRRLLQLIDDADLIYMVGGSPLNSLYSVAGFYPKALVFLVGSIFRKPIVLSGQTIGPFYRPFDRWLARYALNRIAYIAVRDEGISTEILRQLRVSRPTIIEVADDAWALEPASPEAVADVLRQENIERRGLGPLVGITTRFLSTASLDKDGVRDLFAQVCDQLVELFDATIIFVPMFVNEDPAFDDRVEAKRIKNRTRNRERIQILQGEYTPEIIKGVLGTVDLGIGTRYHGVLFTLSMSKPAIAITLDEYYTMKMMGVMRPMGQAHRVLTLKGLVADKVVEQVKEIIQEPPSRLIKELEERGRSHRQSALTAIRFTIQLLTNAGFKNRAVSLPQTVKVADSMSTVVG